ncbi:MAG TPA: YdiU family protein [Candidatus Baltobacteraceae bacterium]|nr:YdiU family protein [Candidatus Baltobacteraceae bacterium]
MDLLTAPGAALEELKAVRGYAETLGAHFVEPTAPTPLPEPYLVAFNPDVAALLGLRPGQETRPEFVQLAAGNARFRSVEPFAALYAGHQFGTYVPALGDGRAITLGEFENPSGERYEWQLKGAGVTAFSRFGDGRAVLRSTIREYLAAEALAALGIPTTRSLAIAGSAEPVFRELPETAAVLSRVAPSHVRFGSFEAFHYRRDYGAVRQLADYTIARFYPHLAGGDERERYARFLREVVVRTARLVAHWQAVGFAHGVLNTDNMSILGLTLDYGPYGFLDAYDPGFICNHTDAQGRYSFERQPTIGLWNCHALAAALSSLVTKVDAEEALGAYEPAYHERVLELLSAKFGLSTQSEDDPELFAAAFAVLERGAADYTRFFRALSALQRERSAGDEALAAFFVDPLEWDAWLLRYRARLASEGSEDEARRTRMLAANPKYVLRNYLAQEAIAAAEKGDFSEIARLHGILRTPFAEQPEFESYASAPPEWARHIEVSCSS